MLRSLFGMAGSIVVAIAEFFVLIARIPPSLDLTPPESIEFGMRFAVEIGCSTPLPTPSDSAKSAESAEYAIKSAEEPPELAIGACFNVIC